MVTLLKPFGHCFGVLKALEIAKDTVNKYPDKNIYVFGLLVHNEEVNETLKALGVKTIKNTDNPLEQLKKFTKDDIVIADANSAVGLAGVMGGLSTEVEETTKNIF